MPDVHSSAVIEGEVSLADDVAIGPHCVLRGRITIGRGTRLIGGSHVNGPVTIGCRNLIYPGVSLGFVPQSLHYDPSEDGCGLVIGDGNAFRENVTIHRAMTAEGPTRVGDENYFMAGSHAGHDCRIGSRCTFANGALLAGHVHMGDGVNIGGNGSLHQFVRVGRGAMISGLSGATLDIPPFFLVTSINVCASLNLVGLRRSGVPRETIDDARWAHDVLCRRGLPAPRALEVLEARGDRPIIAEYIDFVTASDRGICTARHRARRAGQATEKTRA